MQACVNRVSVILSLCSDALVCSPIIMQTHSVVSNVFRQFLTLRSNVAVVVLFFLTLVHASRFNWKSLWFQGSPVN